MVITNFLQMPVFIYKVFEHQKIKQRILDDIDSMGEHSMKEPQLNQVISNTDWHLNSNMPRPYYNTIRHVFNQTINNIANGLKLGSYKNDFKLSLSNYWFQQYEKGDYHMWHAHIGCFYSNAYYIELPQNSVKTTFKILDKDYEFDVEEGDVISFPATVVHCSKPNTSEKRKTVISFNITSDVN